jgi:hypothetical protein
MINEKEKMINEKEKMINEKEKRRFQISEKSEFKN